MENDVYSGSEDEYFDDEDERLTDDEMEELIRYGDEIYQKFVRNKDIETKSKRLSEKLFVEFFMLEEVERNNMKYLNEDEYKQIQKDLYNRRKYKGGCSLWRDIGLKYYGDRKMWDRMYDWEIDYYNKHHK